MKKHFQELAIHALLKSSWVRNPRFSLTFRWVENEVPSLSEYKLDLPSPTIEYIRWMAEEIFCRRITKEISETQDDIGMVTPKDFVFIQKVTAENTIGKLLSRSNSIFPE